MLHIHNGDSSADTAKESSLPGEHFAWRESLMTGPTRAGLSGSEWRSLRAQHLSQAYGVDFKECEQGLLDQEKKLSSFEEHDEVVLWFEHDLFCQTNLLYLLNWFDQRDMENTRLSLICIGEFPGKENFRGLGELRAEQMASLFPGRQQVTTGQLKLAQPAWQAYCSSDPAEIEKVLEAGAPSFLSFVEPALQAHLRRFPSTRNGLGSIENKALELIDGGSKTFIDVFPRFGEAEPVYGLGDAQFWLALQRMNDGRQPLIKIEGGKNGSSELTPDTVREARFEITEPGKSVLHGEADFVELNGIDFWLGGVHLSPDNLWRWDDSSGSLVGQFDR